MLRGASQFAHELSWEAVGHAYDSLTDGQALALGDGVALFLAADVAFRRVLCLGAPHRAAAAQLAALALLLTAALAGESALRPERYAASH